MENGSLVALMVLAHSVQPIKTFQATSANTRGLDNVFPPDDSGSSLEAHYMLIYTFLIMDIS